LIRKFDVASTNAFRLDEYSKVVSFESTPGRLAFRGATKNPSRHQPTPEDSPEDAIQAATAPLAATR